MREPFSWHPDWIKFWEILHASRHQRASTLTRLPVLARKFRKCENAYESKLCHHHMYKRSKARFGHLITARAAAASDGRPVGMCLRNSKNRPSGRPKWQPIPGLASHWKHYRKFPRYWVHSSQTLKAMLRGLRIHCSISKLEVGSFEAFFKALRLCWINDEHVIPVSVGFFLTEVTHGLWWRLTFPSAPHWVSRVSLDDPSLIP